MRWVLFSASHTYTSEIFDLVVNKVYGYADDSTLLAVVRKPVDRLAVAASLNRDLARIQEWCNHWCLILTPYKTKVLLVSRSRTLKSPHGDLVMSVVFILASPNLDILGVKCYSKLIFEDHVREIVSLVSQRICFLRLVKPVFLDTSVLLRCYYAFILPILENCSSVWGSAPECHFQHLTTPSLFGGQTLPRSEFFVVVILTSC